MAAEKKGLALASLILGIAGIPTAGVCGVGAITGIILGILALNKIKASPREFGGHGMAVGGIVTNIISLVMVPIIGIIAAIAIPSLLRARVSANEAQTIGDIRTVISGEAAYQSSNGGFYGSLECLATPVNCLPNYPAGAPQFLDAPLAAATEKSGYRRTFHPGLPAEVDPSSGVQVAPSSLQSYAYTAVPITPNTTGVRGFCGDSSGLICQTPDGSEPGVSGGQCDASCTPLR